MTFEDPVEYHIPLIRQTNIRGDIGLDFASGIKTIFCVKIQMLFWLVKFAIAKPQLLQSKQQ